MFDTVGKLDTAFIERFVGRYGVLVTMDPLWILRHPAWAVPWTRRRAVTVIARPRREDLDQLVCLVDSGRLRVVVERTYPLGDAAEAHRRSEEGHVTGKLILTVSAASEEPGRG